MTGRTPLNAGRLGDRPTMCRRRAAQACSDVGDGELAERAGEWRPGRAALLTIGQQRPECPVGHNLSAFGQWETPEWNR